MAERDLPDSGVANFLQKFRDINTRQLKNFSAHQFLEVWNHYDKDGSGYIEGEELDNFLKEFILSVLPSEIGSEAISDAALQDLKEEFMLAYDENEDNRIEIAELAQMLPTEENFLLLFRRENPLESSLEFIKIWKKFDEDGSGYIESGELVEFLRYLFKERIKQEIPDSQLQEYATAILKLFDQNGDGRLQLSEMAKLMPVKENFLAKPLFKNATRLTGYDIDRIFKKYDKDDSGTIEGDELEAFLKDLLELTGEDYDEEKIARLRDTLLEQWDMDKDGSIDRSELRLILLQHKKMAQEAQQMQETLGDM